MNFQKPNAFPVSVKALHMQPTYLSAYTSAQVSNTETVSNSIGVFFQGSYFAANLSFELLNEHLRYLLITNLLFRKGTSTRAQLRRIDSTLTFFFIVPHSDVAPVVRRNEGLILNYVNAVTTSTRDKKKPRDYSPNLSTRSFSDSFSS